MRERLRWFELIISFVKAGDKFYPQIFLKEVLAAVCDKVVSFLLILVEPFMLKYCPIDTKPKKCMIELLMSSCQH